MNPTTITWIILAISSLYGLWGLYVLLNKEYAKRYGNRLRRAFGVKSTGEVDGQIFDRLGRGGPAIALGFGLALYCLRILIG